MLRTAELLLRSPYRDLHPRFREELTGLTRIPEPEDFDDLVRVVPQPDGVYLPRFVRQNRETVLSCGGYEQHVAALNAVPTRPESAHDFCNMLVWAHFPRLRWALNSLHVDPTVGPKDPRNGRAPAQNLAATFDESGLLVASTSRAILDELRELRFRRVLWELRQELLATTRFFVVGHGTLEALLAPPVGLTARSLQLLVPNVPPSSDDTAAQNFREQLDARAAHLVASWRDTRPVLDPVPVLALPGYWDNASVEFYEDLRNVRFVPLSRRPRALTTA